MFSSPVAVSYTHLPFEITRGLKQEDGLAPVLFNICMGYVIRKMSSNACNLLFNKSTQIAAYADDVNLMGRSVRDITELYLELEENAKTIGLTINTDKTKAMTQTRKRRIAQNLTIGEENIEMVERFTYLGVEMTRDGSEEGEIRRRVTLANKAYFSLSQVFRSKEIHRAVKIRIYKTIIRPIATYGAETWIMTEKITNFLNTFERKILRRILGPINENGVWRIRFNHELYQLYKEPTITTYIKIQRLRWAGHLVRMERSRAPNRVFNGRMEGRRPVGRPRKRWEDEVSEDSRSLLHIDNWKRMAKERDAWRHKLEEARAQIGL